MHLRLSSLYECGCDDCRTKINLAADPKGKDFKSVLKAAENAFKYLHEKGSYKAEDITDKPYQKLISETNNVLSEGLRDNVIPPAMMAKMENDTFIFSGLKTHAQLLEASSFLRDEKGQIRSFDAFAYEFNKVNEKYNQNYLEAEHSFALRSSQMAANWAATDPDGRYNLQYRTANDDRVRENHRALQDITLPKEDSFWLSYYPPNGWRCRCTAVEVRKSKFELSDSEKAIQAGEKATSQIGKDGKNKLEIFRFNPGAEQKVFPPKHPYNKVKDADVVKEQLLPKYTPEKLPEYEKELEISINKDIFKLLSKTTPLNFTNPKDQADATGAYYYDKLNIVVIPLDSARKSSKWKAESTVYHEFGHAADWQNNLKNRKDVKDLMDKYRKSLDFKAIDDNLWKLGREAYENNKHDEKYKVGAAHDTINALNSNYGAGHSNEYWKIKGNKEAEFLAHSFENKFSGNDIFKRLMPDLYNDSIILIDNIIKELENR